jgi:hypothetical protein
LILKSTGALERSFPPLSRVFKAATRSNSRRVVAVIVPAKVPLSVRKNIRIDLNLFGSSFVFAVWADLREAIAERFRCAASVGFDDIGEDWETDRTDIGGGTESDDSEELGWGSGYKYGRGYRNDWGYGRGLGFN